MSCARGSGDVDGRESGVERGEVRRGGEGLGFRGGDECGAVRGDVDG